MSPLSILLAPPVPPADTVGLGEAIAFWILGPLALAGGLLMVFARNAVHSALWLAQAMLCLGALYMIQQAPFLGFVQIIVYTGAIMMLFLFVLMLVGKESAESVVEVLRGQRVAAHQHQHEQEQHHDGAGVDDDLREPDERPGLDDVEHAEAQHRDDQEQRRVHGVAGGHRADRTEQGEEAEDPERDGLAALDVSARGQ